MFERVNSAGLPLPKVPEWGGAPAFSEPTPINVDQAMAVLWSPHGPGPCGLLPGPHTHDANVAEEAGATRSADNARVKSKGKATADLKRSGSKSTKRGTINPQGKVAASCHDMSDSDMRYAILARTFFCRVALLRALRQSEGQGVLACKRLAGA